MVVQVVGQKGTKSEFPIADDRPVSETLFDVFDLFIGDCQRDRFNFGFKGKLIPPALVFPVEVENVIARVSDDMFISGGKILAAWFASLLRLRCSFVH